MSEETSGGVFGRHAQLLSAEGSGGVALRDLVLHLWNGYRPVDLGRMAATLDEEHWRFALEILASYRAHGENDAAFLEFARGLAKEYAGETAHRAAWAVEHFSKVDT